MDAAHIVKPMFHVEHFNLLYSWLRDNVATIG